MSNKSRALLAALEDVSAFPLEPDYFEICHALQEQGARDIFIAEDKASGQIAGYVILNFQPRYALFNRLDIPEIQDLNVRPAFRMRGIGEALVMHCEDVARKAGADHVGIAVGLHSDYGAAQRLYARLGYLPDGAGVTYDREGVTANELRPVDDDLCLMMVKDLA